MTRFPGPATTWKRSSRRSRVAPSPVAGGHATLPPGTKSFRSCESGRRATRSVNRHLEFATAREARADATGTISMIRRRAAFWPGLLLLLSLQLAVGARGGQPVNCAAPLAVLLTFEDGPVPESLGHDTFTERVLNVLRARRASAAFFVEIYARKD